MKHNLAVFTLLGVGLTGALTAVAQDSTNKMEQGSMTVTGCLSQGDGADQYMIRDANGKTYSLMGSKVNLKPHVGHQVAVTGMSGSSAGMGGMNGSGSGSSGSGSSGSGSGSSGSGSGSSGSGSARAGGSGMEGHANGSSMQVASLKMISTTCQ